LTPISTNGDEFTEFFETKYDIIHPSFIGDQFIQLFEYCKAKKKLIIVFLYGDNIPTSDFCSLALTKEELTDYLDKEEISFWVGKVTKEIEKDFFTVFGIVMPFPFLALVGNVQGSFTILELITENMLHVELIEKLKKGVSQYKLTLEAEAYEEKQRQVQRLIKEEQNRAFQKSLDQDVEKEQIREMERTTKSIKLVTLSEARMAAIQARTELPPEPDKKEKSIRVGIRLPDGSRVERRFSPSNTLKMVFDFAAGTVAQSVDDENFLDDSSPPLDALEYVIPWSIQKYELIQNYPKKSFTPNEGSKTLEEFDLGGQTMLFMQRKV